MFFPVALEVDIDIICTHNTFLQEGRGAGKGGEEGCQTLALPPSRFSIPCFLATTSDGALAKLGLTSNAGFLSKKFLGLSNTFMLSVGMTGKSSGAGKWVRPKVCQRTRSVLSMEEWEVAAIQSVRVEFLLLGVVGEVGVGVGGSPEVWGTCRPAG